MLCRTTQLNSHNCAKARCREIIDHLEWRDAPLDKELAHGVRSWLEYDPFDMARAARRPAMT
jgi:hypothetical protein